MNERSADPEFKPSRVSVSELERIGEGRQAELFVWLGGVVKLFRNPRDITSARREAADMLLLSTAGLPMPRIVDTVAIEERPGIVMERLDGTDQLTLLGRKPWTIWKAAKNLARLHAEMHATVAPEGLRSLRSSIRTEIEGSKAVPRDRKQRVLATLDALSDGISVCHWDFHPGNVIETADGPKVIDWANVRRGHALADVVRTLQILRSGALPPGTPFLLRTLTAFGRAVLSSRYLYEYRRLRPFHNKDLEAWGLVSAASRLSYGLAEERERLLGLLRP